MENTGVEFIVAWATVLGAVLAAFGVLFHEMRRRFADVEKRFDKRFDDVDKSFAGVEGKIEDHGRQLTAVRESVARIEGRLGYGFAPAPVERAAGGDPPERAA